MTDAAPALKARDLTLHYPVAGGGRSPRGRRAVHAVDDVDIDLWPSQVTAVVGESGSGKSSLARMLCRLTKPTGGRLWLAGSEVPLSTRRSRTYRRHVQLILQDPFASLNPVHTIRYQLRRPVRLHGAAGPEGVEAAVEALLEKVKVTPPSRFLDRLPHELSGGQLQRIAIARCLAVNPQVLLADEPVSMLDVSIRLGVLNLLEELCQQEELAVLYITHDIASARYLATTVMVMYAGQIVESGSALQVVDQPSHPYTQLLVSASADPDRPEPVRLTAAGAPPSLIDPPSGCRFHPRCPHAMPICSVEAPPAVEVAPGQRAACWLHVDPPRRKLETARPMDGAA
ncbi:MAG: ABC transporter ATP-binding protein [Acidimicrobiaceae bacterium]|nr:ABC transporter ATP-binding protein [Acidimicrobiaceae bacterium]